MMKLAVMLAWLAGMAAPAASAAQDDRGTPLEIGRSYRLESRALGETRTIDVSLPEGYAADLTRKYPVLYVLDGEFEGQIAIAIARFYATMSQLPPMIVVGVSNIDRMRDMTPAPVAGFTPPSEAAKRGGADRFLAFLADELAPWVDQTYRTAPMRVLVGHSLGGLFGLYALVRRPQVFIGYVVMEPAVWWNNRKELEDARAALGKRALRHARILMVNADPLSPDTTQWGGAAPMVRRLSITGETHASMAMAGMMRALRTMFADFRPTEWRPGTRPIAMLARYDSLAERVGYAVPVPEQAYAQVIRMSIHSRYFDDAERVLVRMERTLGPSAENRELRDLLAEERATPQPANFIPLEIPARRPTPREARLPGSLGRSGADGRARDRGASLGRHDRGPRSHPVPQRRLVRCG